MMLPFGKIVALGGIILGSGGGLTTMEPSASTSLGGGGMS